MSKRVVITETELAKESGLDFKVEPRDLIEDLKAILKEYYIVTFCGKADALSLKFNNGQKFKIIIKEQ